MRSPIGFVLAAALVVVAVGLAASTAPTLADDSSDTTPVTAIFQQAVARGDGGISLSVRLASANGEPVARQPVEFFVTPVFLGERPVLIRAALTNSDGVASVIYEPTWDGEHRITALYAGDDTHEPIEATSVLQLTGVPQAQLPADEHLNPLRRWATPGAIVVVLSVWSMLAFVAYRVGWGIWSAGQRHDPLPPTVDEAVAETVLGGGHGRYVSSQAGDRTWHGPGALSTDDDSGQSETP